MDKERIKREIDAIYNNCKTHMKNTLEDWEKAYNALLRVCHKYNNTPWVVAEVVKTYGMLEKDIN